MLNSFRFSNNAWKFFNLCMLMLIIVVLIIVNMQLNKFCSMECYKALSLWVKAILKLSVNIYDTFWFIIYLVCTLIYFLYVMILKIIIAVYMFKTKVQCYYYTYCILLLTHTKAIIWYFWNSIICFRNSRMNYRTFSKFKLKRS